MTRPTFSARRTPAPTPLLDQQAGFGAGLQLAIDEFALPPNAIRRAENVDLSDDGLARKRRGTRQTSAAPLASAPVLGGAGWVRADGAVWQLAVAGGTLLTTTLAAAGSASTWTPRTGALSTTALPHAAPFTDGVTDCVYLADGGALAKFTGGAGVTRLAGSPAAVDGVVVYHQRLIGWRGSTVYYSGLGSGDGLGNVANAGGAALVQTFGDREIVGAGVLAGTLYLLHVTGISTFTGTTADDIAIGAGAEGLTGDVGCVARQSVVATDEALFFLSDRGFYALSAGGLRCLSLAIDPLLRDLPASAWASVWGVHARSRRQVRWWLPGIGILAFAYRANGGVAAGGGAWCGPWTGGYLATTTTCLWESEDADGAPIVLRGTTRGTVEVCDDRGGIVRDSVAPDRTGGSPITLRLGFRRMTHGDLGTTKSYRFGRVTADLAGSPSAALAIATASGAGSAAIDPVTSSLWDGGTWDGGVWDDGLGLVPYRIPVEGAGPYADLTLVDGSDRETLVAAAECEAYPTGRRQYA